MDPDVFFKDCDSAMEVQETPQNSNTELNKKDTSLELMDIFTLMDNMEKQDVGQSTIIDDNVQDDLVNQEDTDTLLMTQPENISIENTVVGIKPQAGSKIGDFASIKDLVTLYFEKYGITVDVFDFEAYVTKSFDLMFPYCKKCDTYLKKLQYILIMGYGIGLTEEALERISVSEKLQYQKLKLSKRLVGVSEITILQQCTEEELKLIRKYSLTEKATESLLGLYRAEGEGFLAELQPYIVNKDYFETLLELYPYEDFKRSAFSAAIEQKCLDEYKKSLEERDKATQILIEGKGYNKVKNSLKSVESDKLMHYANFHYLETIVTLLDSDFSNMEFIEKYLKTKNEIGDYLADSNDMIMLKLLNKGYDIHYAILNKLYNIHNLVISSTDFEQHKKQFSQLALSYIRDQLSLEDIMLHTVFLLKNHSVELSVDKPIRDAVYSYITDGLTITNSSKLENNFSAPETYQFISGNSSYVFNVYDFCNYFAEIESTIRIFTENRKNVKIYRTTPEICILAFGNGGGSNFISEDRSYNCSLKNWCKGAYDKSKIYSVDEISLLNGLTVLYKYERSFKPQEDEYEATREWMHELYNSKCPHKADLVMDYLIKNPKSLTILLSKYKQAGIASLSRVLDLTGFNQAFCFLRILVKGFCGKEPECTIRSQRRPTRSEIIIKSKRYGSKICTFETIFSEITFELLMNELKNANTVKISYVNSIVIEFGD